MQKDAVDDHCWAQVNAIQNKKLNDRDLHVRYPIVSEVSFSGYATKVNKEQWEFTLEYHWKEKRYCSYENNWLIIPTYSI